MARKRDQIFAGFGAFLFLGSACAGTIFYLLNSGSGSSTPPPPTTTAQACPENSVTGSPDALPEVFKPATAVSTLQTTDLAPGTGAVAKSGDCLQVKYFGTLASDGSVFDENFDKPTTFQFVLGQQQVIPGWDQGVPGLKVGGTRRLVIPAALGYGKTGSPPKIPADADLVFVVKLVQIKK